MASVVSYIINFQNINKIMIKANELRVGNYLQLEGENYHVNEIYNNLQCVELQRKNLENPNLNDYEECDLDCNDLMPTPLTEEWLLNFGANKYEFDHKSNQYRIDPMLFVIRENTFFDYGTRVKLQYVHQLQNLYFALTGEELVFSSTEP